MKREKRYFVIKKKDVFKYLNLHQQALLNSILMEIEEGRSNDKKQLLECAVVESDWPEYEKVWKLIASRVDAEIGRG